ncbi:MAG: hypothetical protein RLW42_20210, partial [Gammaproteobacteria bacterium]
SRVEGNIDLVRDGVDGVFFPYGDSEALAAAIGAVLADPVGSAARARAARARMTEDFSAAAMCRGYADIYQRIRAV